MVEASDLTCRRASISGIVLTVFAARVSAKARASSPVFHSLFQLGLSGAPTKVCISGLISAVGAGNAFAGTSSGARSAAVAAAGKRQQCSASNHAKELHGAFLLIVVRVRANTCYCRNRRMVFARQEPRLESATCATQVLVLRFVCERSR